MSLKYCTNSIAPTYKSQLYCDNHFKAASASAICLSLATFISARRAALAAAFASLSSFVDTVDTSFGASLGLQQD